LSKNGNGVRTRRKAKGIFCLEGDWTGDLRKRNSVEPILSFLHSSTATEIPYVHRDVATIEEFEYYLLQWTQKKYANYPILYLAFHGWKDALYLRATNGRHRTIGFDELEEILEGKCGRRVIHFGSCGTVGVHGARLNRFMNRTGAVAISGYQSTDGVEWLSSSAFEILYFAVLQENSFTKQGLHAVKWKIRWDAPRLIKQTGFRLCVRR
jgi:hypothetical protein